MSDAAPGVENAPSMQSYARTATAEESDNRRSSKRPFGLYAITFLLLVNAVLIALDVTRTYVSLGLDLGLAPSGALSHSDIDRVLRLLSAGGYLAVAIGIWTLRRWAWVALMIVVGIALGEGIIRYLRHEPRYLIMLFNVLIVFYLNQRNVQRLFRPDQPEAAA